MSSTEFTDLLIGLDLGTASSKAVLTTADGEVLATAVRPRPDSMSMPRPGWAEVDAEAVWWADVVQLTRELVDQLPTGSTIGGLCVSGVGPCLLLCDADDRPVRPGILYGIDMRATAEIEELNARFGEQEILARGGSSLSTQAVGPKALWVQRREPEVWSRAAGWFNAHSYAVKKLTGEYVLDHHTASQCDPLYDIHAGDWYEPWYAEVMAGLPAPRLAWPTEVVGSITETASAQTGLPVGTPVCLGTIDAWSEAFSAGVRRPGDVMIMYGSTLFFVQVLDSFASHPQLWTTAGVDRDSRTLAAGMATSGILTQWIAGLAGGVEFGELVDAAREIPAGSDGLLLLPYFAGERSPIFDPRARGVIAGLHLQHTPGHLFRAVYEGTAFGVRQILELLDSEIAPVSRLVAVGGGTQGGLWTQIVSDVTGRVQQIPEQTIGASYGDALMAAIGTGLVPADADWTRHGHDVTPNPEVGEIYDRLYADYVGLYPATADIVHRLAELQESTAR